MSEQTAGTDAGRAVIEAGQVSLGIELGSTRIKAVLIGPDSTPLANGAHEWQSRFVDRMWTYDLEEVVAGLQDCFADLARSVRAQYGLELSRVAAIGISAMMHGYLVFDEQDRLLTPFRTWRNTNTGPASSRLTEAFSYNIPHRWSVAHLYQAVLNGEEHVPRIARITTLSGYVHRLLTDRHVLGIGDASGMFPIDIAAGDYNADMLATFDRLVAEQDFSWRLGDILPTVLTAGEPAGELTDRGALLLDPTGTLQPGVPLCPPEGDAGTGMVATNSLRRRTGNVSAGTSIFAMVVLEHELSTVHPELDLVTTPSGDLVAMAHCNNGTTDLDAWVGVFDELLDAAGARLDKQQLYPLLYRRALEGDADCGGVLAYNYLSGEPITGLVEGRPAVLRSPGARLTLANLMRSHLYATLATLRLGMDILLKDEGVRLENLYAHGGLFKTAGVGQRFLAASLDTPVTVGEIAGEGGAWGVALLAQYLLERDTAGTLDAFLAEKVFADALLETMEPDPADVAGFDAYMRRFEAGLTIEQAAVEVEGLR